MTNFSYKTVKDKVEESYKNKLNIELCINDDLEKAIKDYANEYYNSVKKLYLIY